MSVLGEFSNQQAVEEAGGLTELELAVLALPREQLLEADDQKLFEATREKLNGYLTASVATRDGKNCTTDEVCHLAAKYRIILADGTEERACEFHLIGMLTEDCKVELIDPPPEPEPEEPADAEAKGDSE